MKKIIRLTEGDLNRIIRNSIKRIIRESNDYYNTSIDDFYSKEDNDGNQGEEGMVKSYDIGYYDVSNAEEDAEKEGMPLDEYLKYWFSEIQPECPFTWKRLGGGYGHNGDTIAKDGNVVIKDIYGQIMIDEYPPMQ